MKAKKYFPFALMAILLFIILIALLTNTAPTIGNIFTGIDTTLIPGLPTPTAPPTRTPVGVATLTIENQFSQVDQALNQFLLGNIAYNAPEAMQVDETVTIELLLNPSISPEELETQIDEPGAIESATIEITPRMRVELRAKDKDAFEIQAVHNDSEQLISGSQTTRWAWWVKAKKEGTHNLTVTVFRLAKLEGEDYWPEITSYETDIAVKITLAQRIKSLDWKWVIATIISAILIPAFWRWADNKKKEEKKSKA